MNSLQAGLIAVAVFVIALFASWMWLQNWRSNRRTSNASLTARDEKNHEAPADAASVLGTEFELPRMQRNTPQDDLAMIRNEPAIRVEPVVFEPALAQAPVPELAPASLLASQPNVDLRDAIGAQRQEGFSSPAPATLSASPGASALPSVAWAPPPGVKTASELAPRTAALPTALPIDDRLNVYATISTADGRAIDCQDFAPLADRSMAWGRVFRMSAWEYVEDLSSGGAVQALCLAMPIASRAGPLDDNDVLDWKRAVSAIATPLEHQVVYGGDVGVGTRAAELDQFLAAADVICVMYLVRKDAGSWSGTRLRGTLEANGFRLQADGRFVYFEVESETPIFSAVDGFERSFTPERLRTENISALRLVFEASHVAHPVARFDVYRQTLRALARLLEAEIKDGNGTTIDEDEFAALRDDVLAGSNALAEAGIECGSLAAQALFR